MKLSKVTDRKTANGDDPIVSVIIPVYNAEAFIADAVRSVCQQSFSAWELIIVNDASTDNTASIVRRLRKDDKRIRFVALSRKRGVSSAMNLGVRRARGRFIARLDADDTMEKNRLKKQIIFLSTNPLHIAVGGQCNWIAEDDSPLPSKSYPLNHDAIVKLLSHDVPIRQPSLMINRGKLPKGFRWYNTSLAIGEDIDFYYRLLPYGMLANLDEIVVTIRHHSGRMRYDAKRKVRSANLKTRYRMKMVYGHDIPLMTLIRHSVGGIVQALIPHPKFFKRRVAV